MSFTIKYHQTLLVTLACIFISCSNNEKKEPATDTAYISVEEKTIDYGVIAFESDGRRYFEFKNTSDNPLIINRVGASCGCTRPEWPEEPLEPGETGRIGITYNTKITGSFRKSITVYSNAENSPLKLFIKGTVEPSQTYKTD